MIALTIDGTEVEVSEDANLIEAAAAAGVDIPTYCYHPGLTVVGQCRICFVEVEGLPRLVTACSTRVRENMVVHTASERVQEARAAVMEFLLANHPLDCPVCDQAGECFLQDYSVEHGLDSTHMVDERRTFPGLERRLIGPRVGQNQNRCIHCTRCVRFTREIAETNDLTLKSRGNHAFIDTFDGSAFDNPWSACAADVCPVGALTAKEFRFRARVWHLEETSSVCPGCSIGCAISVGHRDKVAYRFLPRHNPGVNGWWMCDYGRSLVEELNSRDVERPLVRAGSGVEQEPASWRAAVTALRDLAGADDPPLSVVLSANLSNETIHLAKRVFVDSLCLDVVVPVFVGEQRKIKDGYGEWVHSLDAHANSTGAHLIDLRAVDRDALETFLRDARGPLLFLDSRAHPWLETEDAARAVAGREVAVLARDHTPLSRQASLVLPATSWIETEGSYTSSTGWVQLARPAFSPTTQAKSPLEIVCLLAVALGLEVGKESSPRRVFQDLVDDVPAFSRMTYEGIAGQTGQLALEDIPYGPQEDEE